MTNPIADGLAIKLADVQAGRLQHLDINPQANYRLIGATPAYILLRSFSWASPDPMPAGYAQGADYYVPETFVDAGNRGENPPWPAVWVPDETTELEAKPEPVNVVDPTWNVDNELAKARPAIAKGTWGSHRWRSRGGWSQGVRGSDAFRSETTFRCDRCGVEYVAAGEDRSFLTSGGCNPAVVEVLPGEGM